MLSFLSLPRSPRVWETIKSVNYNLFLYRNFRVIEMGYPQTKHNINIFLCVILMSSYLSFMDPFYKRIIFRADGNWKTTFLGNNRPFVFSGTPLKYSQTWRRLPPQKRQPKHCLANARVMFMNCSFFERTYRHCNKNE